MACGRIRLVALTCSRRFSTHASVGQSELNVRFETGRLARFADGCAVCRAGDTAVMVTAVSRTKPYSGYGGFVPLTVDYRQKAAAAGRIPTNFLRRELGPSDIEILTSRMIDRSIRVLFPKGYCFDTQIMCNVLAVDSVHDPAVLAINAASAALTLSDIPWNGPVGAVRLGVIDGMCVVNPTRRQLERSALNMVLTGTSNRKILMLDMSGKQIPAAQVVEAVRKGLDAIEVIVDSILSLKEKGAQSKPKREYTPAVLVPDQSIIDSVRLLSEMPLRSILEDASHDKISRDVAISTDLKQTVINQLKSSYPDHDQNILEQAFSSVYHRIFRQIIFERRRRCDGRGLTDLRPIECHADLYSPLHGSALFQRGQTQVLCTIAFDSLESSFRSDPASVLTGAAREKQFLLHYEFPPYATNEIGATSGRANRRELGHGALAEKALRPVLPKEYPFTIRLTSEVLESNGSSSMASVCGGSLALMDAGVPISAPVSGVAIGLVTKVNDANDGQTEDDYLLLTDILGIEDYMGDMDFKIAGTHAGLTAMQLDLKIPGMAERVLTEAIDRGNKANEQIRDIMSRTIDKPRATRKSNGPVVETLIVPPAKRHRLIGIGGLHFRRLESEIGIRISQVDDTTYTIFSPNSDAWNEAKERIDKLLQAEEDVKESQLEFGGVYEAKIVEIKTTGVMVQLYPEMTPVMIPNSQLDMRKVKHPSALGLAAGQRIMVKYFGRDSASGHMRLSRKVLQQVEPSGTKHLFEKSESSK